MPPASNKEARLARIGEAFRPAAPIDDLDLFAGREKERMEVVRAVPQRGSHVGLYGERGVGKTSLAKVLVRIYRQPTFPEVQAGSVNCHTEDVYETLWESIFEDLGIQPPEKLDPESIRRTLERLDPPALIVIDELDRLEHDDSLTLLADTIKTLSDHVVHSTLVLVGVGSSMIELIGEHESIVRNVAQIEMPRMSATELERILKTGCAHIGIEIDPTAVDKIVSLAEGLPHYTHLLGERSAERTVQDDRDLITLADVNASIPQAVARHSIESDYHRAERSSQPGNLYREVLLACALVPKDQLGYFKSGQVRDPLEIIVGKRLEIPAFSQHISEFQRPERGSVLHREGKPKTYSYRFPDPAMSPYVILHSLAEGLITHDQLEAIQGEKPDNPSSGFDPSGHGQLF